MRGPSIAKATPNAAPAAQLIVGVRPALSARRSFAWARVVARGAALAGWATASEPAFADPDDAETAMDAPAAAALPNQCSGPRSAGTIVEELELAEAAFGAADAERFLAATDAVAAMLPCLDEPLPRYTVGRLHRVMGIRAFANRAGDDVRAAFAAARAVEPNYVFPDSLVPAGHPVLDAYNEATDSGVAGTLPKPDHATIAVDGRAADGRPVDRATLVQLVGDDGGVRATAYLWPRDPMFAYPVASRSSLASAEDIGPLPSPHPARPLWITAGIAGGAAGLLWAWSAVAHDQYESADLGDKEALRTQTNSLVIASASVGVAALGCGVGAAVVGRW